MPRRMVLLFVVMLLIPTIARAQDESHWGIVGSFTPNQPWNVIAPLSEAIFEHEGSAELSGTDFSIGIARGSTRGGDWGVSFVRRAVKDGSRFESLASICINGVCEEEVDELYLTEGVTLTGVEFHTFVPFVSGARVQFGMNFGGGVGTFSGQLEKHDFRTEFTQAGFVRTETITTEEMEDLVALKPFFLGKAEAAVAFVLTPALKIRASGGFNFPGYTIVRITAVYLFGAD